MSENAQLILLDYLTRRYAKLKHNLTRLLGGNDELASDALHDTWVRLNAKDDYGKIENPGAYVTRMMVNIAVDVHRRDSRLLTGEEAEAVMDAMEDPAPGPEQTVEARFELAALAAIMDQMPERRQQVAFLVHFEGLELRAAAKRLKISERTVVYELTNIRQAARQALRQKK